MRFLDQIFLAIRSCAFCYRFTLFTRILLAGAFIPTGMVKLQGDRFTLIGPENPIGAFFEAMYQTGLYWQFLGLTQVAAAILLLIPRVAHLGAAIFLGVVSNIFVITLSLQMRGTPFVTGPMVFAVLFLVFWDYHRFRGLLTVEPFSDPVPVHKLDRWEFAGFSLFAFSLISVLGVTRDLFSMELALVCLATGSIAGLLTLFRFLWVWWHDQIAYGRSYRIRA